MGSNKDQGKLAQGTRLRGSLENEKEEKVIPSTKKGKKSKNNQSQNKVVTEVLIQPR